MSIKDLNKRLDKVRQKRCVTADIRIIHTSTSEYAEYLKEKEERTTSGGPSTGPKLTLILEAEEVTK